MRTELVAGALKNVAATTLIESDAIWHSESGSVLHLSRFPDPGGQSPGHALVDGQDRRVLGL